MGETALARRSPRKPALEAAVLKHTEIDAHVNRPLCLSSVADGQNVHLTGLIDAVGEVDVRFNRDPFVQAVLRSHPSGSLRAFILVSRQYPQYLMTYSTTSVPRIPLVYVYLREEPFRGLSKEGMLEYVMRAFAAAIVFHGKKRKVDEAALLDWFASIPGHDRFEPSREAKSEG